MIAKIEKESKESDKLILDTLGDQYASINSRFSKAKKDRDAIATQLSKIGSAAKDSAQKSKLMNQPNMNN